MVTTTGGKGVPTPKSYPKNITPGCRVRLRGERHANETARVERKQGSGWTVRLEKGGRAFTVRPNFLERIEDEVSR